MISRERLKLSYFGVAGGSVARVAIATIIFGAIGAFGGSLLNLSNGSGAAQAQDRGEAAAPTVESVNADPGMSGPGMSVPGKSGPGKSGIGGGLNNLELQDKAYTAVDIRQGVWNDGQAALWDLNILDHFRIFGAASRSRGYSPDQPIKFSHITHVQKNQMECQFCHWSVAKAAYAAIPEVETCIGCHKFVPGKSPEQQAEINTLKGFYDRKEPIPWEKVHVMPEHVKFNHKRHVAAGVACHECHGQVPKMAKVERVSSFKMGWCIDCHRTQGTSIDCFTCHH